MDAALLVLRLLLAGVFLIAGGAKLADLAGSRRAAVGFGVPERLATAVGAGLPACELAIAVALIPSASARFGALGALLLLSVFVIGIALALSRGSKADCHCFGQLHSAPIGRQTLVRNGMLAAAAGFVLLAGWNHPGVSATGWVAGLSAGWAAALALGVLLVPVIGFSVWFSLQLLSQNGRMFARLERIEAALHRSAGLPLEGPGRVAALGAGLEVGGLPVAVPAPAFTLPSTDGDRYELASLLTSGMPLLLVFSDAGCGPCDALLPDLAGWQRQYAHQLAVAVIASGEQQANRAKAERYGLARVLLQSEREVSDAYEAHATPMAVVIGADGLIQSPTVGGVDAVRTLVAQAISLPPAVAQVPSSNGHRDDAPTPETSQIGERAPALVLADLDGDRIALRDLYGDRTLAIFWNPGCGFCQSMLADLKGFERDPPAGAARLVVISSGDPEQTREHALRSRVLLDPEGQAMAAFQAHGTPMGVLIENGIIVSPVAAGADALLSRPRSPIPRPACPSATGATDEPLARRRRPRIIGGNVHPPGRVAAWRGDRRWCAAGVSNEPNAPADAGQRRPRYRCPLPESSVPTPGGLLCGNSGKAMLQQRHALLL